MKTKYTLCLSLTFLLLVLTMGLGQSQQTNYIGLYPENWVLINPAILDHAQFEKKDNLFMVNSSFRQQWLGFEEGPRQTTIRIEHILTTNRDRSEQNDPIAKWGLFFSQDKLGSFVKSGISGNFAYLIELQPGLKIAGGLNVGFFNQSTNLDPDQFQNWDNDVFAQGINTQRNWVMNADAGILIRKKVFRNRRFYDWYFGLSANQLANVGLGQVFDNGFTDIKRSPHYNLLWGCLLQPNDNYGNAFLEPTIWIRYLPNASFISPIGSSPVSFDLSLRAHLESHFWFGGGVGTSGNANAAFGYQYQKLRSRTKLKGGMMVNVPTSRRSLGHSLEIFLGASL